ncbi:hypothetical protein [Mucilaginibacter phyllosphaerae]|uniref:DUF3300 domain-containing protein n=1 Tax=Mucilaginibacter phyllosphaerae TaxID=1812349 RepID=A0ABR6I898_9SPHI|nr:hypothetical protein [Mucilaginibacter phyllosphaerae]MBB3969265.1 hypothetical protein [Mucilaginibacter phyllosphaerae]GGH07312.1 hypothetical protein GCM10007352_12000 [Mucilaginibacter phyllosphaerae]
MKKSFILSAILFGSLIYSNTQAQISVHIGFNVPARRVYVPAPPPQPVMVYDNDEFDDSDDYYYLPEVEAYYSIPRHCYYYQDGGRWVSAAYLPGAYRNYDWRSAQRYEIRGSRPYMYHDKYLSKWGGNYNRNNWNWNRRDNNYAGRSFDNRRNDWNRSNNRNDWNRNNNRNDWNRDNNRNDWNRDDRRNDRPNGGFNQTPRDRGNWGQPQQPNRNDDNRGGGRGRDNQQPSQPSRNDNRGGGRDRDNRGGNDHTQIAQNRGFGGGPQRPTRL